MSQSQCGRSPSQVGYASSLGEPLPHQLANAPQAHPQVTDCSVFPVPSGEENKYSVLATVSGSCPKRGQVAYVLLTRPPLSIRKASFPSTPLDLHVLGMPPAFVLSQDQTLQ